MAYIIENAHVLKGEKVKDLCLLIEKDKITTTRTSLNWYKHVRMDADAYIMTPTHVLLDLNLPLAKSFEQKKAYYLEQFIVKGCTTILTAIKIKKESELKIQFKKIRNELLDCPVDYVIAARVPSNLLKASFIRKCKKEKVPAIFVEIINPTELERIPWGWVKEAMFPYNSPLIPIFKDPNDKKLIRLWKDKMQEAKIPSIPDEIQESIPLSRQIMGKIGIYPKKANLHDGGEVSYNFYLKDRETVKMVETELFTKDDSNPLITIHKSKVIRAGKHISYRPGYGEYVEINKPSFYLPST